MERTLSQVITPSALAPVHGKGATPFAQQTVGLTKQTDIELTWQAHYWRTQYEQRLERETALKAEVEALQATIRELTQHLYGTKSEQATSLNKAGAPPHVSPNRFPVVMEKFWALRVSAPRSHPCTPGPGYSPRAVPSEACRAKAT
jgi:hypothetical protein